MNAATTFRPAKDSPPVKLRLSALMLVVLLAGCTRKGDLEAGGVYTVRSACPQVAVPAETGDMTLFNPPNSTAASAIDVEAAITDVRSTCNTTGADVVSTATFNVVATRRNPAGARQVVLPYFDVVLQAGDKVVAKRISAVALNFADGSVHAQTSAEATARIARSAAALPQSVLRVLNRPRKAGQAEADIDPLSDPRIRSAVADASFQHLVGFQLTTDQLRYNATR